MSAGDHEHFERRHRDAAPDAVAWFSTFDPAYPNSILSSLSRARDNAATSSRPGSLVMPRRGQPARRRLLPKCHRSRVLRALPDEMT
jgi:hypothetical protein